MWALSGRWHVGMAPLAGGDRVRLPGWNTKVTEDPEGAWRRWKAKQRDSMGLSGVYWSRSGVELGASFPGCT